MTVATRDFSTPARPSAVVMEQLQSWMERSVERLDGIWKSQLCWPLSVELGACQPIYPAEIRGLFTTEVVSSLCHIGGEDNETLIVFPVPLAIALLNGLLGESVDTLPDVRELTPVETALYHQLLGHVADSFRKGWPGDEAPMVRPHEDQSALDEVTLLQTEEPFLYFPFHVNGPFGQSTWAWLAPKELMAALVHDSVEQGQLLENSSDIQKLKQIIHGMKSKLTVHLGHAELDLPAIRKLSVGDVVLLDQPIDQPLTALVDGKDLFFVWGGRVGEQHAIQIEAKQGD